MTLSVFTLTENMVAFFGNNPYRPLDLAIINATGGYVQFRQAGVCKRIGYDVAQLTDHHPCLDILYTLDMQVGMFTTNNGVSLMTLLDRTGEVVKLPSINDCVHLHAILSNLII